MRRPLDSLVFMILTKYLKAQNKNIVALNVHIHTMKSQTLVHQTPPNTSEI